MTDRTADISQIKDIINLYGISVDALQWHHFDEIFTEDMHADYGPEVKWNDRDSFKRDFEVFHALFETTQHLMANTFCRFDGDTARVLTYGQWLLIRRNVPGGDVFRATGWYADDCVRTSDGWRIKNRLMREIEWSGNRDVVSATPGVGFKPFLVPLSQAVREGIVHF